MSNFKFPEIAYTANSAGNVRKMILSEVFDKIDYAIYYDNSSKFPERIYKGDFEELNIYESKADCYRSLIMITERRLLRMKQRLEKELAKQ